MRQDRKHILRAVGITLAMLVFLGIPMLIVFLILNMGLVPAYVIRVLPFIGVGFFLAVTATAIDLLPRTWVRWIWLMFLCLCLAGGAYFLRGVWNARIPTVDDREIILQNYTPFSQNTLAVYPDQPASWRMDKERILRLDGATALYPVYAGFVQSVYPEGNYPRYADTPDGCGVVTCTNTVGAYQRLIDGQADVIFAAAPSADQRKAAEEAGLTLHLTPIGKEAFVFFVNCKNPVTSLQLEEIREIYAGEITNWREVGGNYQKIRPFQRAENSGSQTMLRKLMAGKNLIEPEKEDRIAGMGGIIRQVANYRNYENAIGFSFRFYASQMVKEDQIRLLEINGVAPSCETIRDGSYPLTGAFYAVTAAPIGQPPPRQTDAELDAFLTWILSEEGQAVVEKSGYVAWQ